MLRHIVGALIGAYVAATVLFGTAYADGLDLNKLADQVRSPTVQVLLPNGGGSCSATIVSSKRDEKTAEVATFILTAEHCVADAPMASYAVRLPVWQDESSTTATMARAKVVKQGSVDGHDMALLKLDDTRTSYATQVAKVGYNAKLKLGELVYTGGYPLGREFTVSEGRFSSVEEYNFSDNGVPVEFTRANAPISPGNSGGGLFHLNAAGDFELVGVADRGAGSPTSTFGLWATAKDVTKFLQDYNKDLFK